MARYAKAGGRNRGNPRTRRSPLMAGGALCTLLVAGPSPALAVDDGRSLSDEEGRARRDGEARLLVQADRVRDYDIPAQPLGRALAAFGRQSGMQIAMPAGLDAGKTTAGVKGPMTDEDALRLLLAGSGLAYQHTSANAVTIEAIAAPGGAVALSPISVEGAAQSGRFGDLPPEPGGLKADYQNSATKTPLSIRETPQSISVITRDSIEARQARDVNTALELAAGVSSGISSSGGPFAGNSPRVAEQFSLRGQRLDGDRDVRIDGFASNSNRNNFDLAPFERVEVAKGPSSMLYGQGSLGGFVNLVRKKPQQDPAASVVTQVGSFDSRRAEADLTGAIVSRKLLGRAIVAYENSGSFIDAVESEKLVFAPSLELRIGERTRALLQLIRQDEEFLPSLGVPLRTDGSELSAPNIPRSFFFGVPSTEESTANALHASLQVDHEISDRWLVSLRLNRSRTEHRGVADNYGYGFYGDGDAYVYSSILSERDEGWAGELRLDGKFDALGREHRLLMGVERNVGKIDTETGYVYLGMANIYANNFASLPFAPAASLPITFGRDLESRNKAIYGQAVLSVLDRTKVLAGVRYDVADQSSVNNLTGAAIDSKTDRDATFRLGATQELTANITAYAVYAQSFSPVDASSRSGGILDPETGEGYEAGLKSEWFGGQLAVTAAAFRQELDNRAIPDPNNGPGEFFNVSGGLQRTDGLEIEVSGSPYPGLTIGFASAWLDAEYVDVADPNFGLTPPETTDRQTTVFATYELQSGPFRGVGFGGTVVSIGDRWSIQGGQNRFLDGHERFDLHAFYKGVENVDLSMQVRNVLDETYIERSNGAFGYGHYFGSPRAVLVRGRINF